MVGVSTFRNDDTGCLGSVSSPVDLLTLCIELKTIHPYHLPFLAQAYQQLRLVLRNGVYQQFTYVNHAPKASPVPSVALRYAVCLTAPACRIHCPQGFRPLPCRLPA